MTWYSCAIPIIQRVYPVSYTHLDVYKRQVCGLVSNIGREGQHMEVMSLREIKDRAVDMFTTVYIGSPRTRKIGQYMVTPRGYRYEG